MKLVISVSTLSKTLARTRLYLFGCIKHILTRAQQENTDINISTQKIQTFGNLRSTLYDLAVSSECAQSLSGQTHIIRAKTPNNILNKIHLYKIATLGGYTYNFCGI